MSEKFVNRHGKGILQRKCTESPEKTLHQPLFNVFPNEDIGRRTVQLYIEERHMKSVHAQRKL